MKSKLPQFSNEADWEMSIFELSLVLDRVWPHADELDIVDYMTDPLPTPVCTTLYYVEQL